MTTWREAKKDIQVIGKDGQAWKLKSMKSHGDGTATVTMTRYQKLELVERSKTVNLSDEMQLHRPDHPPGEWVFATLTDPDFLASHLFIVHGYWVSDINKGRDRKSKLTECHDTLHGGKDLGYPHRHKLPSEEGTES